MYTRSENLPRIRENPVLLLVFLRKNVFVAKWGNYFSFRFPAFPRPILHLIWIQNKARK